MCQACRLFRPFGEGQAWPPRDGDRLTAPSSITGCHHHRGAPGRPAQGLPRAGSADPVGTRWWRGSGQARIVTAPASAQFDPPPTPATGSLEHRAVDDPAIRAFPSLQRHSLSGGLSEAVGETERGGRIRLVSCSSLLPFSLACWAAPVPTGACLGCAWPSGAPPSPSCRHRWRCWRRGCSRRGYNTPQCCCCTGRSASR
jgi:hypothetical protein